MQLEESASCGFGGCDVDDVALDRGEIWVNPPNAFGILMAMRHSMVADGVITAGRAVETVTAGRFHQTPSPISISNASNSVALYICHG